MRTSRREVRVEDGLAYLALVKSRFEAQKRPHVYNTFLAIMSDFKEKRVDTAGVVGRMVELFSDDSELILKFNAFLPAGYTIDTHGGASLYKLAFPSGARRKISPCADRGASLRSRQSERGSVSSSLPGRVRRRTPLGSAELPSVLSWYSSSRSPDPFQVGETSVLGARRHRRRPPAAAPAADGDDDATPSPARKRTRARSSDDGGAASGEASPDGDSGKRSKRIACRRSSPRKGAVAGNGGELLARWRRAKLV